MLLQVFRHLPGPGIGLVRVDDKAQSVHHLAVEQNVQLDQLGGLVPVQLIVIGGISFGTGFERVEKIVDNFV